MAAGETDVEFESRRYTPGVQDAVFVVGTLAVAGWLAVDATRGPVFGWGMTRLDWLTAFAVVVLVATVVPLIRDPARLRETLGAYPRRPLPVAAALATLVLIAVGIVGPLVVSRPVVDFQPTDQPPFGFAVPTAVSGSCVGRVVDGMCRGSLAHPLGTTKGGTDVFTWLLYGSRTTVQFAFTAVAVVAPVGALAGVTAGYVGGRWDALVTAVADLQQTVPTVIVYFFVATATDPSLFTLVVVYGVFDWGGIARVVRTRTVTERETAYVEAARNAGAGPLYIVRNHLLPNVAPAVVTTVSLLIPRLILVEVALAFLGFGGEGSVSWGQVLSRGLQFDPNAGGLSGNLRTIWWPIAAPALATLVAVTATSVVGDAVQSVTDPKKE